MGIPYDFFPSKGSLTAAELDKRHALWQALDARTQKGVRHTPVKDLTKEKVGKMIMAGRKLLMELGKSKVNEIFIDQFHAHFPDFTWKAGTQKITCFDDLVECVRTEKMTNSLRGICFAALHGFWEKNNRPLQDAEREIMYLFRWQYIFTACDGSSRQRNNQSGFAKVYMVKVKNTNNDRLKNALRSCKLEGIWIRYIPMKSPEETQAAATKKLTAGSAAANQEANEDSDEEEAETEGSDSVEEKPKKNVKDTDSQPALAKVFRATRTEWGFDGWMGLYEGHAFLKKEKADLEAAASKAAASKAAEMAPKVTTESDLIAYVRQLMRAGKVKNKCDLARVLVKETENRLGESDAFFAFLNSPLPTWEIMQQAEDGLLGVRNFRLHFYFCFCVSFNLPHYKSFFGILQGLQSHRSRSWR